MTFVKCLHKTNLLWIFIMGILGSDLSDLIQWWTDFFQILHFASSWQLHVLTWLQALELKMLHITAYSRLYWYLNVMPGSARMEVFGAHYSFWHRSTKRVVQHCDGSLWCTIFFWHRSNSNQRVVHHYAMLKFGVLNVFLLLSLFCCTWPAVFLHLVAAEQPAQALPASLSKIFDVMPISN